MNFYHPITTLQSQLHITLLPTSLQNPENTPALKNNDCDLHLCASQQRVVQQPDCFKTAKLSETVVIKCLTKAFWRTKVWYKLGTNRSLQLIASTNSLFEQNAPFDYRYSMKSSDSETTLTIMNMMKEDVGTYYCGIINSHVLFGSGTVLELEGESKPMQSVLQSPDYIKVQPGDSVTLSCSFNVSLCSEQTSVTWLKSALTTEIIAQTSGNKNKFCGNAGEMACVHNLTLNDVTSTQDGTYLCVVSACGHSLTGTRIQVYGSDVSELSDISPTVIILSVLNVVFCAAVVVLVWLVYSYRKNQHKG
ncbi:uncharacterized protein LOC129457145 [Periophthalmus magnuspinnatus]|uniref:uncharacterized protein LOC129457145 n=1 Tax=Periophthalmus magnuspinnatus TaxID=409849 RepID=UPI002436D3DB|nr:uncharacterized protein LOC129457145 [Periophthalmus magnuspinnatus]